MQHVAAELAARAADDRFAGTVLVTRSGDVVFEACHGLANRADAIPIRPETRFGLASITKMFTAVTVASLVERGLMGFGDHVVDLVPETRRPSTLDPAVTVHHLLSHTSGIADYFEEEHENDDYADLWRERPVSAMRRPADFLPLFGDLPAYRPPGERFQYSNAGFVLLGLVVEDIGGQPFIDAVTKAVFEPAAMADSGFLALDEVHPAVATGYLAPRQPGGPWRTNVYSIPVIGGADGGAFATAADLSRFLDAYARGQVVGPALRDVMLTPHAVFDDGADYGYGLILKHGPAGFGHGGGDPGAEGLVYRFPDLDANVVVLANVNGVAGDVRDLVVDALVAGQL